MTQTLILTPRDRRSAAFFWLGVGVFPVFWAWFTMGKSFPKWQRYIAFGWMLASLVALAATWPQMSERYYLMSQGLPVICFRLSLWLWVWLLLRIVPLGQLIVLLVVVTDVIAIASSLYVPTMHRIASQQFSLGWAVVPLIPALLHLAVEPACRLLNRVQQKSAGIEMYWVCVTLLPLPFIWFTIDKYFTSRERTIAWSWTVIHTAVVTFAFPSLLLLLLPLSLIMAVTAMCQYWMARSKTKPHDD